MAIDHLSDSADLKIFLKIFIYLNTYEAQGPTSLLPKKHIILANKQD